MFINRKYQRSIKFHYIHSLFGGYYLMVYACIINDAIGYFDFPIELYYCVRRIYS